MTKLKSFVFGNIDIFQKSAKDAYEFHKDFIKICIDGYACPNVFEEMKHIKHIRKTRFYKWWANKTILVKQTDDKKFNEIIKKTKERIIKHKVSDKIHTTPTATIIERQPIHQEIEVNRTYHKVVFKTDKAREFEKYLDITLRKINIKSADVYRFCKQTQERLENANAGELHHLQTKVNITEKLFNMMSGSFQDGQTFQTQLRMMIENEKQIMENGFYEKEVNNDSEAIENDAEAKDFVDEILKKEGLE